MKYKTSIIMLPLALGAILSIEANPRLTPEQQKIQDTLVESIEQNGYVDAELDSLHKRIGALLSKSKDLITKDEAGNEVYAIEVYNGESFRLTGEHYIVSGNVLLYPEGEDKLSKVVFSYERQNIIGNNYKVEKRVLTNPSPTFYDDNGVIDRNDDMIVQYFEMIDPNTGFEQKGEMQFGSINSHKNKMIMFRAYKAYLRKVEVALLRHIRKIEVREAAELLFMLQFE